MNTQSTRNIAAFGLGLLTAMALVACETSKPQPKSIIVPSTATTVPQYRGDGSHNEEQYVIRMSDGRRDWEVSFPSTADGYQVSIPLEGDPRVAKNDSGVRWETEQLTAADKELLEDLRRQNPGVEREGVYADGENVVDQQAQDEQARGEQQGSKGVSADQRRAKTHRQEAEAAPTRPSYLLGIAEVQKLYERGKYELAMVRLSQLDKAYPNDVKILSMKGSLWKKLGRRELARRAWEQALQLDPDNTMVVEALKRLNSE